MRRWAPRLVSDVTGPGTANTSRPSSPACPAVIGAPRADDRQRERVLLPELSPRQQERRRSRHRLEGGRILLVLRQEQAGDGPPGELALLAPRPHAIRPRPGAWARGQPP